jgi:hypothetical protein
VKACTRFVKSPDVDIQTQKWTWMLTFEESNTTKVQYPVNCVYHLCISIYMVDENRCGHSDGGFRRLDVEKAFRTSILITLGICTT